MNAYAAHAGTEPVALYLTPDGKHVIAGTLFDATGKNLTAAGLEKVLAKPMTEAVWGRMEKSHWIADGREDAPRTVYVFTDPNCPYYNKLWADARPWVDCGQAATASRHGRHPDPDQRRQDGCAARRQESCRRAGCA